MRLHNNREDFISLITDSSDKYNIERALIEKDYYEILFLKEAFKRIPGLLFKGGTSLSKCHKIIDRFSEDVDLTLDESHFSQTYKRSSIKEILSICDDLGLEVVNKEFIEKHTHANFNRYEIRYPKLFESDSVKSTLLVEMTYIQKTYPTERKNICTYIKEYLEDCGYNEVIKEYELESLKFKFKH